MTSKTCNFVSVSTEKMIKCKSCDDSRYIIRIEGRKSDFYHLDEVRHAFVLLYELFQLFELFDGGSTSKTKL